MAQAVLCGLMALVGKVRKATLHKPLIPACALLFSGGLRQGKDFPGIACGPTVAPPAARDFLQGMNCWFSWLQCAVLAANHNETHREGSFYRVLQVNTSRKQLDVLLHLPQNFHTAFVHNNVSILALFFSNFIRCLKYIHLFWFFSCLQFWHFISKLVRFSAQQESRVWLEHPTQVCYPGLRVLLSRAPGAVKEVSEGAEETGTSFLDVLYKWFLFRSPRTPLNGCFIVFLIIQGEPNKLN